MTEKEILELIESGEKVLLDFFTKSCGGCKVLGHQIDKIIDEVKTPILKIDAEEMTELSVKYGVMKVPQLILVEEGNEKYRMMGFMPSEEIVKFIGE